MNFERYQLKTRNEAVYPRSDMFEHLSLELNKNVGDISNNVKKNFRGSNDLNMSTIIKDCLWCVTRICDELEMSLQDIMDSDFNVETEQENNICGITNRLNLSAARLSSEIIHEEKDKEVIKEFIAECVYYLEQIAQDQGTNLGEIVSEVPHYQDTREWKA